MMTATVSVSGMLGTMPNSHKATGTTSESTNR